MADYNCDMFRTDHEKISPLLKKYYGYETLDFNRRNADPREVIEQVMGYFVEKYGKKRGCDFEVRFLTTAAFIEHYQKELVRLGHLDKVDGFSLEVDGTLLELLLNSFTAPPPDGIMPASYLFNQNHEFNYKKVVKILKTSRTAAPPEP